MKTVAVATVTRVSILTLALGATLAWTVPATAQKPPAPIPPNPLAPTLAMPFPLGIQRGTSLDLTLTGTNMAEPTAVWTSFPGTVTIPTENNNGKDNTKFLARVEVPGDAPLGVYGIRVATTRGLSNVRLFCVDDMPQLTEVDTNRTRATPQPLPWPCVVVGRADAEVTDHYKIAVQAGQRLSFEILGRRLGSAFDPQITLVDPRTGRDLPGGHSNDSPGLQTDPRLTYTFKEAGDYLIEVRDALYRGGPDFGYRLRVGDFPCATAAIPMAVKRGSKVAVQFAGPTVEGVSPIDVSVPTDPLVDTMWVTPQSPGSVPGWPVALAVSNTDEVVEKEPNNQRDQATRVPVPGGVTGRFEQKGDVDFYAIAVKKGQRLIIDAQTVEWNSPTEVFMILSDVQGKELARSNPAAGQRIDYTPMTDGECVLSVEHLHYWGGPAEAYHVSILPYEPGFDLAMGIDRYDVPQGGAVLVAVQVTRRDYTGPIELNLVGPPGVSGKATVAANQLSGNLVITAGPDAVMRGYPVRIRGQATINGKLVATNATPRTVLTTSLGGLPFPPRDLQGQFGLAVTEKPPFLLAARQEPADAIRGGTANFTITATRQPGFTEEIALTIGGLPPNVTLMAKTIAIPKEQNELKVALTVAPAAGLGQFLLPLSGKAKYQNKDFTVTGLPVQLSVALPFDLKVEAAPVKLTVGEKARVKVTAIRKGGYAGPITLAFANLPAGVTAAAATIAMGQDSAEVELTAAANAAVGDKADVNVAGTATAAANQTNPSPNFTVSVAKK